MFYSKQIQAITAIACIFLIVMVIFSLGFLFSNRIQDDMHRYGDRRIEENRDRRRANLAEIFYREGTTMEIIAQGLESIPDLNDRLDLIKEYSKKAEYDGMVIADMQGNAITTRDTTLDISKRQYFIDLKQNPQTVISEPVPSMLDGAENTVVMIASPLYEKEEHDNQGQLIGLVAGSYNGNYLSKKLVAPYSGWGHDLLASGDGQIFAQTQGCPRHPSLGKHLSDVFAGDDLKRVQEDMQSRQNGHLDFLCAGEYWSVLYAPVGVNDWYVFSMVPIVRLTPYKNLTSIRRDLVLVVLITSFLAAAAGYWAFSRKRIGRKLLVTFWGLVLIASCAGGLGGFQLVNIYTAYSKAMGQYSSELSNFGQIALAISTTRAELSDVILLEDTLERRHAMDAVRDSILKTDSCRAALKMQLQNAAIARQWDDLESHLAKLATLQTQILELSTVSTTPNRDEAHDIWTHVYSPSVHNVLEKLQHLIEINLADMTQTDDSLRNDSVLAVLFVLLITTVALVLSAILATLTARSIRLPLHELERVVEKIADYQTDFSLTATDDDEIGVVARAFNTSVKTAFIELNDRNKTILDSIHYSSKIQRNLLPPVADFHTAFTDHAVIWQPRDIVGGDIYWLRNFDGGTVLVVADCTGHGTPGALLTMLVATTLQMSVTVKNYQHPQDIVWEIEKRLTTALHVDTSHHHHHHHHTTSEKHPGEKYTGAKRDIVDFHDGCDLAVVFIAKDKSVKIAAANTSVFVCDGQQVQQLKGQRLRLGDGTLTHKDIVEVASIAANPENKFYIATDGLYDQNGTTPQKFGYRSLKEIVLANHSESLEVIADKTWRAFEEHRDGALRRDDVQLVAFKP